MPTRQGEMSTQEVAEALGIRVQTVQQVIAAGKLKARKLGRQWLVDAQDVERYRSEHLGRKGWRVRREQEGQRSSSC